MPGAGWCSNFAPATLCSIFFNSNDLDRVSQAGVVTPDHTIRTKNWPLVLAASGARESSTISRAAAHEAVGHVCRALSGIFRAQQSSASAASSGSSIPCPASCWCPDWACSAFGRTKRDAIIAADIAEEWMAVVDAAGAHRPLRVDLRSRHVRLRVLAARTEKARRAKRAAARRPDRRRHRRRRRDRRGHGKGVRRRRRGSRAPRRQSCRRHASKPRRSARPRCRSSAT